MEKARRSGGSSRQGLLAMLTTRTAGRIAQCSHAIPRSPAANRPDGPYLQTGMRLSIIVDPEWTYRDAESRAVRRGAAAHSSRRCTSWPSARRSRLAAVLAAIGGAIRSTRDGRDLRRPSAFTAAPRDGGLSEQLARRPLDRPTLAARARRDELAECRVELDAREPGAGRGRRAGRGHRRGARRRATTSASSAGAIASTARRPGSTRPCAGRGVHGLRRRALARVVNQRLNAIRRQERRVYVPFTRADEVARRSSSAPYAAARVFGDEELAPRCRPSQRGRARARALARADALADALERERLIAHISLERSVAPRRRRGAAGGARRDRQGARRGSLLRPARRRGRRRAAAEWHADGRAAARRRVTAPGRQPLRASAAHGRRGRRRWRRRARATRRSAIVRGLSDHGVHAVLATPILAQERLLGVLAFHRSIVGDWSPGEIALAEAVAREAAWRSTLAACSARTSAGWRQQQALLKAAQALTSDLALRRRARAPRRGGRARSSAPTRPIAGPARPERRPSSSAGRCSGSRGAVGFEVADDRARRSRASAIGERDHERASRAAASRRRLRRGDGRADLLVRRDPRRRSASTHARPAASRRRTCACSRRSRVSRRSPSETRRRSRRARGRRRSSAASTGSRPCSASRCRSPETLDAVAQAAADALGGDSAAVLRGAGAALELAGALRARRRGSRRAPARARSSLAACARGGKVLASRRLRERRPLRRRPRAAAAAAGRRAHCSPFRCRQPGGEGAGLVLVFFAGRAHVRRRQLELARAARGGRARRARAQRALRGRANAVARSWRSSSPIGPRARERARSGQRPRRRSSRQAPCSCSGPTVLGADARGRRGRRASAAGPGGIDGARRAGSVDRLARAATSSRRARPVDRGRRRRSARWARPTPMLAAGYAAYLGVPMIGAGGVGHGDPRRLLRASARRGARRRPRRSLALAANAAAALANAELYQRRRHEKQRSEAILANVADGIVAVDRDGKRRPLEPGRGARSPASRRRRRSAGRRRRRSVAPLDAGSGTGGEPPRPIRRGGEEVWLSLTEAVMTRPGRRRRRPDLRLPRHLGRAERRADEVRLRLDRLARAADAAHVDLRLRRDAAAPGRALRRRASGRRSSATSPRSRSG